MCNRSGSKNVYDRRDEIKRGVKIVWETEFDASLHRKIGIRMSIADRILRVKSLCPGRWFPGRSNLPRSADSRRLTKPASGFSENRPQEMAQKYEELPADIEWHLIGHLQTNKVKMVALRGDGFIPLDSLAG